MYRAINVTLWTVLCAALKLVDITHTHIREQTSSNIHKDFQYRKDYNIEKCTDKHKEMHTNMGADRGCNKSCGTDTYAISVS